MPPTVPHAPRAAIYARISKDDPEVQATADQERRCRELAESEKYNVVAVFADDGISAFREKERPAWQRLKDDIAADQFDVVLAVDIDRFSRQPIDLLVFARECEHHSTVWHIVGSRHQIDPSDDDDISFIIDKAKTARSESATKSKRVKASVVRRRLAGQDIGGPRPFGFTIDRRALIEAEAELVRAGHRLVLSGASTYAVVKMFMASGVPPVKAEQWSYVIVRKILTRPRNAALAVTETGEEYKLTEHPAIVSREDHEAVTAILTRSSQPLGRKPQHLASGGVARCGTCGAPLRYQSQKGGIYRCTAANSGLGSVDRRVHPSVKAAELDAQIMIEVVPALMARLARGDGTAEGDGAVRAMLLQRAELERQRDAAQDLYLLPGANKSRVRASLASFAEQIELIETRIIEARGTGSAAVQSIATSLLEGAPSGAALGARFKEVWGGMSLEDQRALVRAVLEVKIHPAAIARKMKLEHLPDGTTEVVVVREGPERIAIRHI